MPAARGDRLLPDERLDAAAAAARAAPPVRVDRHVAELAAEPVRAAEQPSAEHDAAPDADLAEDADEVVDPDRGARPVLGERREVRLVLDVDGQPETRLELVADGDAVPAEVRREHDGPGGLLDEPGDGHRDPDRAQALAGRCIQRLPGGVARAGRARARGGAAIVAVRAALVAHGAGEVLERDCDVVDVHLETDADEDVCELERHPRAADAARRRRLAGLADELELDELVDEAGDGPAREPGARGDLRPRTRPAAAM